MTPSRSLYSLLLLLAAFLPLSESACRSGCSLALGSYRVIPNDNASYIASLFGLSDYRSLGPYNPDVPNLNSIRIGSRLHVPFSCDCINGEFLGHNFSYRVPSGYTYIRISSEVYANLTTVAALTHFNSFSENNVPTGANLSVIVNCSCGDGAVSRGYGLFETYPIHPGENLSSVAAAYNFTSQESLLQSYNHGSNFTSGMVFIPTKDFGLAKLTEVGAALQSKLVGTFGCMPPEYAHGVISLKFQEALGKPDPKEELKKLVDPRLNQELATRLCSRDGLAGKVLHSRECPSETKHEANCSIVDGTIVSD